MKYLILFITGLVLTIAFTASAQDEEACPAFVDDALIVLDEVCSSIGRNEACYGNLRIDSTLRDEVSFELPGDIVNISTIQSFDVSPYNPSAEEWGVALLRLQANFSDMLPGQNATMLVFGDVRIDNLAGEVVSDGVAITAPSNINIRQGPSTETDVVGTVSASNSVDALARTPDSAWVQIALDDDATGWVFASLFNTSGDLTTLPIIEPDFDATEYAPLQAFYFQSGVGDASCLSIPQDGVVLQTPRGAQFVDFRVNGVDVTIGSTVFLRAIAGDGLYITTLEGTAIVESNGGREIVTTSFTVRVPLGDNLQPTGIPRFVTSETFFGGESLLSALPQDVTLISVDATAVRLPANQVWTRTDVDLEAGQSFVVLASGVIKLCEAESCGDPFWDHWITPNGEPNMGTPSPGSLMARVGGSPSFFVGSGGEFTAPEDGRLEFSTIDSIHEDNVGAFGVIVIVPQDDLDGDDDDSADSDSDDDDDDSDDDD